MRKIFDKGIMHIIPKDNGYYMVTSDVDSKVYYVSEDNSIVLFESYSKVSYVYPYGKDGVFIPSLYYRAYGYKNSEMKKYRTKADIIEGIKNAVCNDNSAYYYTRPSSADAKVWRLDFDTGINEEVQLGIPRRKGTQIRYAYIDFYGNKLCVIYYYFASKDICFDDMYIRMYEKTGDEFKLISEKLIERDVREVECKYSEERQQYTFIFRKMEWDGNRIRIKAEYLATLESDMKVEKVFDIKEHIDNGARSFAVSYEKKFVVVLWREKICVYNMDTGEIMCNLSEKFDGNNEIRVFFDVYLKGGILVVAGDNGVWELTEEEYLS